MQGTSGRSHSLLLQALNNTADGSLRLALRVKINEKKWTLFILPAGYNISCKVIGEPCQVIRLENCSG